MELIKSRITKLRDKMSEVGVSVCLIPTSDCHDSEYLCPYYQTREYFSGFTGSAGTLVVSKKNAALFTDGRYFVQAREQLKGSGIKLMKIGEPGTPKLNEYLISEIRAGEKLGLDGRLISAKTGEILKKMLAEKDCTLEDEFDPAALAWTRRPSIKYNPLFKLEKEYSGEDSCSKIAKIRKIMETYGCDAHIISSLDDIAYILNLRGNDIEYCPVFMSYLVIFTDKVYLYTTIEGDNSSDIKGYLASIGVAVREYDSFYDELEHNTDFCTLDKVLLDTSRVNYRIVSILGPKVTDVIDMENPSTLLKAVKNATELSNIAKANVIDGVAMLRFMRWIKEEVATGKDRASELSAARYLDRLRGEGEGFIELSFETISAYASNGAIVHYAVDEASDREITVDSDGKGSLLLVDSGAHYVYGTTDVTRTYGIGEVSQECKSHYTLVLKAMLRLMNLQFMYGVRGNNLDDTVRSLFWEKGLDFRHGTGHGIGYALNVHEGPNRISYRIQNDTSVGVIFEPGMLTSDEPGIYLEGKYGIRIENDIVCEERFMNEYGRFLGFYPVTYVPIDTDLIIKEEMTKQDVEYLNAYHTMVYDKLSPCLNEEEREYLKKVTSPI